MDARFEVIDAFVDGERVDPAALKDALAEPAGRDYLVDVWLLRDSVHAGMADEAATPPLAGRTASRGSRTWIAAAAVAAMCLTGGYFIGSKFPSLRGSRPAAPTTVATEPRAPATSFPVPAPTRVIRLELGSSWQENSGGN
jgi:hypothetical protein